MSADIIMVIDEGRDLKGEFQDVTHNNSIEIQSWDWEFAQRGRYAPASSGQSGARGAGSTASGGGPTKNNSFEVTDLKIKKYADLATVKMMKAMFNQKTFKTIDIYTRKLMMDGKGPDAKMKSKPYLQFCLTNARFSSLDFSETLHDMLAIEHWKISFEKVKIVYIPQQSDSSSAPTVEVEWTVPWLVQEDLKDLDKVQRSHIVQRK